MTLNISDTLITSDTVSDRAELRRHEAADGSDAWVCQGPAIAAAGYGARLFDRNQAITAMTIAEEQARPTPDHDLISALRSELR